MEMIVIPSNLHSVALLVSLPTECFMPYMVKHVYLQTWQCTRSGEGFSSLHGSDMRKEVDSTVHVAEQSGSASICESFVCENVDINGSVLQLARRMGSAFSTWTRSVLRSCSGIHNVITGIALICSTAEHM